jgi:PAS domain S-box-containing protein
LSAKSSDLEGSQKKGMDDLLSMYLAERLSIGLWRLYFPSNKVVWAGAAHAIHGVEPDFIPTLETAIDFYDSIEPGEKAITEAIDRALKDGVDYDIECRLITAKGNRVWVRTMGHVVKNKDGEQGYLEGIIQDISAHKALIDEAVLQKNELEYLTDAFDHHSIVSAGDLAGKIIYCNEAFQKTSGYTVDELSGANHRITNSGMHDDQFWKNFWETISSGNVFRGDICNRKKTGEIYWLDTTIVPHINEQGKVDRYMAIRTDITEKRVTEVKQKSLEKNMIQMQKMEAIGLAVGGIAHDFNNILAVSLGYAQLLQLQYQESDDKRLLNYLKNIESSSLRAKSLVEKMLAFSRGSSEEMVHINLSARIPEFLKLLHPLLPATVDMEVKYFEENVSVFIANSSMDQILMNLCLNAKDAIDQKGHILIFVNQVTLSDESCTSCLSKITGDYAEISVMDNGYGIDTFKLSSIFQPFYSTKGTGKGSGMGLAVIHGLVHGAGGHIVVKSNVGSGTVFSIYLPLVEGKKLKSNVVPPSKEPASLKGLHVVIVDDEIDILEFFNDFFSSYGIEITTYHSSPEFLHDLEMGSVKADVYLLDITMPRVDGIEVNRQIKQKYRDAKAIAVSGYSEYINASNFKTHGFEAFIEKPVDIERILGVLAGIMNVK